MGVKESFSNVYHEADGSIDKWSVANTAALPIAALGGGFLLTRGGGDGPIDGIPTTTAQPIVFEQPFSMAEFTGCGPYQNSADARAAYAESSDPEATYNMTRTALFQDAGHRDLAVERVEWMGQFAPWQLDILGKMGKLGAPGSEQMTMVNWVGIGSVAELTESVDPNNWACPMEVNGNWEIVDTDANELALPVGEPVIVLAPNTDEFAVSFDGNGNAIVTYKDGSPNTVIPADQFVLAQTDMGPAVLMSKFACDNMQTPLIPGTPENPTTTTIGVNVSTTPTTGTSTTRGSTTSTTEGTTTSTTEGTITTTTRPATTTTRPATTTTVGSRPPGTNPPGEITTTVPAPPQTNTPPHPTTSTTAAPAPVETTGTTAMATTVVPTTEGQTECTAAYCAMHNNGEVSIDTATVVEIQPEQNEAPLGATDALTVLALTSAALAARLRARVRHLQAVKVQR